ncbi:uncharacterized protein PITG_01731 [Phytophthora infestans T30-4]|uniref:Transmembrane protein, putative n=1 Tax=Phytophthora infestans (strain T30-4) TaxID=403677 RepID=D0MTY6_PHYIT|nr:uncharacterized protein PITG_01731 [Phytophthora infestans T30-4]EEY61433.1 transmembrane protein, putative [Phytophthora infestans T30-4]|eukprot:XP_002908350.1 transmembrane protein, putative [Phytophthora infestans T30-4]
MTREFLSPHCSSWSFRSNFSFSGGTGTVQSPLPTVYEQRVNYQSRRSLALLINYFAAGLFHGVVPALVYPLFKIRLGLQGYQTNATQTLLGCAWHGKLVLCLLTDCVPIGGRRRISYIYIGWTLVLFILGLMMILHPDDRDLGDAPRLIFMITVASVGHLLVDAACDGLMVEATAVHAARFIAESMGTLLVAVGMNSEEYSGGFSFEMSLRGLFAVASDTSSISVATPNLRSKLGEFWHIMQQRATWQIASFAIHELWLHTDPFMKNLFLALANGGVSVAASVFVHRRLLSTSWHSSVCIALLGGLIVSFPVAMVAVFDIWRSKFFFLAATEMVGFADCIAMMVRMLAVVEIAEPGFESSTYGLVTSVYNLADPVATALSNAIGSYLQVFDADIQRDADDVRVRAGALFAVLFTVRAVVGLGALPLLPNQRHDARQLKARGGSCKRMGLTVFLTIGASFSVALVACILSVFQSTSCLRLAGGVGC